ncbi:hypothetical protein DWX55_06490 [Collinsella sp. AF19-7AC]|uniref:hypothetical protein n=1 Tax=unclassified Collinsella TaxID=2637548 RepID=UPI000E4BB8B4|nr:MULTISPECIES: hypothetical protein [unclassified Collinsella]RGT03973.1 hypothetical protein DWX55_06490 [Collinsella sp. AF19-7AC]RGT30351.1 hypothetical protein DWX39_06620 [Collinsella sp. AF19-1LB]RHE27227.1 hypothetical protein DW754_06715 [Collinsella sp. AM29-10AC]
MQPNRKEIETIARVRAMNHEAQRLMGKVKALEDPEPGAFRDRINANYDQMRLAMERIGLLLEVRLHTPERNGADYIFQKLDRDLDILDYEIGVLDTLIDLWQLQNF